MKPFINIFYIILLTPILALSQSKTEIIIVDSIYSFKNFEVDTINLYDSARNVEYCLYLNNWYKHDCENLNDSINPSNQDRLVLDYDRKSDQTVQHYRFFNSDLKLTWEAKVHPISNMIVGDVKYYNNNGIIDRIEHYNMLTYKFRDQEYHLSDGPDKDGKWIYFYDSGSIKEINEYGFIYDKYTDTIFQGMILKRFFESGELIEESVITLD